MEQVYRSWIGNRAAKEARGFLTPSEDSGAYPPNLYFYTVGLFENKL